MAALKFYIDNIALTDYGVRVSKVAGIIGLLKPKQRNTEEWTGHHGKMYDTSKPVYEERDITLDCWVTATSKFDLIEKLKQFTEAFNKDGFIQLKVNIDIENYLLYNVLVFNVVNTSESDYSVSYNTQKQIGTFQLKFVEPEPVKKVIRATQANTTISFDSTKAVNIHWGDGHSDYDLVGTGIEVSRAVPYDTYISITGDVDVISNFATNGAIIHDKI